jgi:Protein of unknown function (DUF4239)
MSSIETWFWGILLVGALAALAVGGALLLRRAVDPAILERHNEVAGFIYSVIGVVYAVLLGFTAIIVWEQFRHAQQGVEREANALADLYRDAQVFPPDVRRQLEIRLRAYARVVVEKEWPAMAKGKSSPEAWEAANDLWRAYHDFRPQDDHQRIWYGESLQRLNEMGEHRRLRLLTTQSAVPGVLWVALLGAGAVTVGFSFLFGTKSAWAQITMTAGLSLTIGLVLLSIFALEHPFSGITRVEADGFRQLESIIDVWSQPGTGRGR